MKNKTLRIKEVLRENKKTLTQVAADMGVTAGTLSITLNGNPTVKTLDRFASAVGCDIRDLFK